MHVDKDVLGTTKLHHTTYLVVSKWGEDSIPVIKMIVLEIPP